MARKALQSVRGGPAKVAQRKTARLFAPKGLDVNPLKVVRKTAKSKQALVGGASYWTVHFYANKDTPSGKPDIVFPARDEPHARKFVAALEKAGAIGVATIDNLKTRV